jgi:hypothetical protein
MPVIVGIDMSKNSPGVCVREGEKLTFLSFIRGEENKKTAAHYAALRECGVFIKTNSRSCETKEYSESEVWKVDDSFKLAETIVSSLPEEIDMVGLEGFSYGSKGNSGLDIAGYAYSLRVELLKKYGPEKLCIFSPGNVKKTAGKGNANKDQIMDFFLREQKQDLNSNLFWKSIFEGEIEKKKPVDDLVDSYYVQECAYAKFLSKNNNG